MMQKNAEDHNGENLHGPAHPSSVHQTQLPHNDDISKDVDLGLGPLIEVINTLEPVCEVLREAGKVPALTLPLAKIKALTRSWRQAQRCYYGSRYQVDECNSVGLSITHYLYGYTATGYHVELDYDLDRAQDEYFFERTDGAPLMPKCLNENALPPSELNRELSSNNEKIKEACAERSRETAINAHHSTGELLTAAANGPHPTLPLAKIRELTESWGVQSFCLINTYTYCAGDYKARIVIRHRISNFEPPHYEVESLIEKDWKSPTFFEGIYHFEKSDCINLVQRAVQPPTQTHHKS